MTRYRLRTTETDTITGSLSADDILNVATLDDETKNFIESLGPFEIRIEKPHDTKPFETIQQPDEIIAKNGQTLLYSKDGGESWFELDLNKLTKPKKSKWHRVEDKMPDEYKRKQVITKDGVQYTAFCRGNAWYMDIRTITIVYDVTHWRELPKRPKESKG